MFREIFKKDLKLQIKDLRFQLFCSLIVLLFIISTISSITIYRMDHRKFSSELIQIQERVYRNSENMMNLIQHHNNLYIFLQPNLLNYLLNTNIQTESISTNLVHYNPLIENYSSPKNRINWLFIIGVICSFVALLFSFNSISYEKKRGTLKLTYVQNVKRSKIILSKFLSNFILITVAVLTGIISSLFIVSAFLGFMETSFYLIIFLFFILSLIYLAFFILLGLFVSLLKNHYNAIVICMCLWLFFVVIIPRASSIIAEQLSPLRTVSEYNAEARRAYIKEYNKWRNEHGSENTDSNGNLRSGIRAQAFFHSREKQLEVLNQRIIDEKKQYQLSKNLSSVTPYHLLRYVINIVADLGHYQMKRALEQLSIRRKTIESILKSEDANDVNSLNLFYNGAFGDRFALDGDTVPFSNKPFSKKELLVMEFSSDTWLNKMKLIILPISALLMMNALILAIDIAKFKKYDIR